MGIANAAALLACGLAMGFGALGPGFGLGYAASGALRALARQPSRQSLIFRNMLVGQAITETPAIFSLVVAFLLYFSADKMLDAPYSPAQIAAFLGGGICIGVGSIGSGIGSGVVAHEALDGMSANPSNQGQVLMLMLVGQAWAQTGCIFALVISLFLLTASGSVGLSGPADPHLWSLIPLSPGEAAAAAKHLGAGLAMGLGAIGSSLGIANVGGAACRQLATAPGAAARIKTIFFVGSATTQSPSVFSLILALLLLMGF